MVGVDLEHQTILPRNFRSSDAKYLLNSIEKINESTSNGKKDKDFPTRMTLSLDLENQIIFPRKGGSNEVKQLQNSVERISESTSSDKKDQGCPTRMCLSFEEEKECYVSAEKLNREVGVSRNGVSARDMMDGVDLEHQTIMPRNFGSSGAKYLLNSIKISESTSNGKMDKDFSTRMKTSLEASKGCRKLSIEGQLPKKSGAPSIRQNGESSSQPVLGTLSVDLENQIIFPKKGGSIEVKQLQNSVERISELTSSDKKDQGCPTRMCSTCLDHTIFICPCEIPGSEKLTDARRSVTLSKITPGGNKEVNLMLSQARSTLDGMVKALTGSHKRKICFDGDFSFANFCRTRTGEIKLIGLVPRPFTTNGSKLDRNKMASIIEQDFFAEADVPISICELVELMKNGVYKEEDLMADHISMKPELERLAVYQMMYRIVKKLKKTDNKGAYKDILDIVKSHNCWHDWCKNAKANLHLKKIWDFINPGTQRRTEYRPTAESLLHYLDNAIKHLPDHSYDELSRTTLFYDFEIDHILTGTFGAVLDVLQRAMFRSGKMISWV